MRIFLLVGNNQTSKWLVSYYTVNWYILNSHSTNILLPVHAPIKLSNALKCKKSFVRLLPSFPSGYTLAVGQHCHAYILENCRIWMYCYVQSVTKVSQIHLGWEFESPWLGYRGGAVQGRRGGRRGPGDRCAADKLSWLEESGGSTSRTVFPSDIIDQYLVRLCVNAL